MFVSQTNLRILNIMNSPRMTQAEFAVHRGVQKSAVSNWKKKGLLVFVEDADKLKVDVARSDARINANVDPTRGRPTTAQSAPAQSGLRLESPEPVPQAQPSNISNAREDLMREQTIEKRMKNARDAGELVLLADFESRCSEYGRLIRERAQGLIRDTAERLAADREPRSIIALLTVEFDMMLDDLAARMLSKPKAAPIGNDDDDVPAIEDEILADAEASE